MKMAQVEVKVGSIWRENDKRLERYVQVISIGRTKADAYGRENAVEISVCLPDGSWRSDRTTQARLRRFGKSYKLVMDVP